MVFVTPEKCLGQNRSSFLKLAFLHGLHPSYDSMTLENEIYLENRIQKKQNLFIKQRLNL